MSDWLTDIRNATRGLQCASNELGRLSGAFEMTGNSGAGETLERISVRVLKLAQMVDDAASASLHEAYAATVQSSQTMIATALAMADVGRKEGQP